MQSGEFNVIGKDEVQVSLLGFPSKVKVEFTDHCMVIPCNPHHRDSLEWEVVRTHHHHGGFTLIIKWEVTGVRDIKWTAWF